MDTEPRGTGRRGPAEPDPPPEEFTPPEIIEVEAVLFPVGGGGLIAGSSLALRRRLGAGVTILGVEPEGARTLGLALEAGASVTLERILASLREKHPVFQTPQTRYRTSCLDPPANTIRGRRRE